MELLTQKSKIKPLIDYYSQPEQIQKTHQSVRWFLVQILWFGNTAAKDQTLSIYDAYLNSGLAEFAIFEDDGYLLWLVNYILSKNKSEQESDKYIYTQDPKYKNISPQDLDSLKIVKSENISDIYIQKEWLERIHQILGYINNYYNKAKPSLLKFLANRLNKSNDRKKDINMKSISRYMRKNTQNTLKVLKEVLFLSDESKKNTLNNNHWDFAKRSVYGWYMLMFYIFSHLANTDVFVNRNDDFRNFWDTHLVKNIRPSGDSFYKEEILSDYIWFSDSIYRDYTIDKTKNLPEYQIIWNTKTTNSTVRKLQTNRQYGFAQAIKDLGRATIIWDNWVDLTKLINDKYIYFTNQKINFDITDKWSAAKILETAKMHNISLHKNLKESLQKLITKQSAKRDTVSDSYQEIKFIINNKNKSNFELKFMTKSNFEKSKINEDASEYIYKYMDQMKLKNRWEKLLTKDYIIEFWKRKITKNKDSENFEDNIIKTIYGKYNEQNIKQFVDNICNRINKSYKAILIDNKIWYINKNEKDELQKYEYIPKMIDISADKKFKIYPHDIISNIWTI